MMLNVRPLIDVLMLSYCKTAREFRMTAEAISTLLQSEAAGTFHILVVETASPATLDEWSDGRRFGEQVEVIFPERPFHYNEFLQIGYSHCSPQSTRPILISNNDVLFEPGFATQLLAALTDFDSVSPWCPAYHERFFPGDRATYEGTRTSLELCGWALMFRRDVLKRVDFTALFPHDFAFWYQDNYYAHQLRQAGLRHALVRDARVHHLFEQSHDLLPPEQREAFTEGSTSIFQAKLASEPQRIVLTLAISAQLGHSRNELPGLIERLAHQAAGQPVELLCLLNNQTLSTARMSQLLAQCAQGEYFVCVNLEHAVDDHFVDLLLNAIRDIPTSDCVTFDVPEPASDSPYECDSWYCYRTSLARTLWQQAALSGDTGRFAEAQASLIRQRIRLKHPVYERRSVGPVPLEFTTPSAPPQLTLCILSIPNRVSTCLTQLLTTLSQQCQGRPVEILVLLDNQLWTIGAKRNALLQMAQGTFVAFIDDDDDVSSDYVAALLAAMGEYPEVDCIVFDAWVTLDGGHGKRCSYGCEFMDQDLPDVYLRQPNHICCLRLEQVQKTPFESVSWHEDFKWATAIRNRLRSQCRIPRVLYFYRYDSRTSAARRFDTSAPARELENSPGPRDDATTTAGLKWPDTLRPPAEFVSYLDTDQLPVFGFLHVLMASGWEHIVTAQLQKMQASGLWNRTVRLYIGLLGGTASAFWQFVEHQGLDAAASKIEVLYCDSDVSAAELPTLEALRQFACQRPGECLIYYLHTKGITWPCDRSHDWRTLMEHFLVLRFADCLAWLSTHDTCGVNWIASPTGHFSGNFWWARSSYLAEQPPLAEVAAILARHNFPQRHAGEFWLGWGRQPRVAVLHGSEIDHYDHTYPRSRYAQVREVSLSTAFHTPSAWQGLENRFQDLLEPVGRIQTVVEIGVEFGYSLFCLAAALPHARVIGVDPYDSLAAGEQERLSQYGDKAVRGTAAAEQWVHCHASEFPNLELVKATSEEAASTFDGLADVVHIDSSHTWDDVNKDFTLWEPRLRPGGCILFHDILAYADDVGRFFDALPGRKARILDGAGLGAWYKPVAPLISAGEVRDGVLISLCMIVRDSAATLRACLTSIAPWVDEIVIVDTGSVDETVEIAEHFGARVFHFPWCDDFSAARNESLRHAQGRWLFWMDSDDTISAENGAKLRQLATTAPLRDPLGYVIQVQCPDPTGPDGASCTIVDHVKLLRNVPGVLFEGRIHEQVLGAIRRLGGAIAWTDIAVVHSGSDHSPEGKQRKYDRDFRLLRRELAERPEHPFTWFNIGMTYADMEEYGPAAEALRKSLDFSQPGESHLRKAYALAVGCYQQLGKTDEAWQLCEQGLAACPGDAELLFRQGILHHHLGRLDEAARCYEQVLAPPAERYLSSIDQSLSGYKARHNLALVLMDQNRFDVAEIQWRHILAEVPDHVTAWIGLGDCLVKQDKLDQALQIAGDLPDRGETRILGWQLRAQIAVARQAIETAREIVQSAPLEFFDNLRWLRFSAQFFWEYGPRSRALCSLTRLSMLVPQESSTFRNLGTLHEQNACPHLAVEALRRAHTLDNATVASSLGLARMLAATGAADEALHELAAAGQRFPYDTQILASAPAVWNQLVAGEPTESAAKPSKGAILKWPGD